MRIKFLVFCLFVNLFLFGQDQNDRSNIVITADHYRILNVNRDYLNDLEGRVFNNSLLNQFFSSEITSFATNIKDQSVEKYFINANSDNKSLAIGRSIDFREIFYEKERRKLEKMSNILTLYTQSGLDKGFSNVYEKNTTLKEYDWSNNLGVGIRFTHFFNGTISFNTSDKNKISRINNKIIDNYLRQNVGSFYDASNTIKENLDFLKKTEDPSDYQAKKDAYLEKKYYETYVAIIDKQIEKIKSEKLYTYYFAAWIGAEYYKPITDKIVMSTTDSIAINKNKFRDWRFEVFGNILINHSSGNSFKLKGVYSKFNTNDFSLKNATALSIQDVTIINDTTIVVNTTSSAFLGNYKERDVSSIRLEGAFLFFNNSIGVSGVYENYLNYNIKNWKLGFPISLKDKEDKPTVNFEIVWREINKTHIVGINAIYSFGKFLK